MTKTARLYGGSLYDLASEEKLTEGILEQMEMVCSLFREEPSYLRLLAEPSIPKTERVGLLDAAFEGKIETYLLKGQAQFAVVFSWASPSPRFPQESSRFLGSGSGTAWSRVLV